MSSPNQTMFIILGFTVSPFLANCIFYFLMLVYSLTLLGNLTILAVICVEKSLHTPMYFFLCNLALEDISFISCTVPTYLVILATNNGTISRPHCIMQLYFFMSFGSVEFFLLAFMSVDRYMAISHPLRYHSIISSRTCLYLVLVSWVFGLCAFIYPIVLLSRLSFCGPLEVNHYYCEGSVLVQLSCSDPSFFYMIFTIFAATISLGSFLITFVSYSYVIAAILKIQSSHGKKTAFSTCSSHLTAVSLLYASVIFLYIRTANSVSYDINKVVSIINSILTPFLNPFIYSLRNKTVRRAFCRMTKLA